MLTFLIQLCKARIQFNLKIVNYRKLAHKNFISAGADIIISNTYQSNQPLLMSELQISRQEADNLLLKTIDLARKAAGPETIVAGSIGPFPDCPASEYDPQYLKKISFEELYNWHLPRFELLAKKGLIFQLRAFLTIKSSRILEPKSRHSSVRNDSRFERSARDAEASFRVQKRRLYFFRLPKRSNKCGRAIC